VNGIIQFHFFLPFLACLPFLSELSAAACFLVSTAGADCGSGCFGDRAGAVASWHTKTSLKRQEAAKQTAG
jgi:hypothetical protein